MADEGARSVGGYGVFSVEMFIAKYVVYLSGVSPRPHDTGMVTIGSQELSEFELHVRAILGLPILDVGQKGPSASAVIRARQCGNIPRYDGFDDDLASAPTVRVSIIVYPTHLHGLGM